MIPAPRNVLVSYHYWRDADLDQLSNFRVIGDSGAYSARSRGAEITTRQLVAWHHQWWSRIDWMASLDVIGDPAATRKNWFDMYAEGIEPVPTIHYGDDPALMDPYVRKIGVDFIGLGGMVGVGRRSQMEWLTAVFTYARRYPNVRFHGWGVAHRAALLLPFYSVDSTGWGNGYRYGHIALRDPHSTAQYRFRLDGAHAHMPAIAHLLRSDYGVDPADVDTSGSHNRSAIVRLAALSASVLEQRMRANVGPVTPPTWGVRDQTLPGPHLHLSLERGNVEVAVLNALTSDERSLA